MSFCTAINCMDGRAQIPVIRYLRERFGAEYVDMITDPGPNLILAIGEDSESISSIIKRVELSVQKHKSIGIAVIGHHDCAGNLSPADKQIEDTLEAVSRISRMFLSIPVIGLWLNEDWEVQELPESVS